MKARQRQPMGVEVGRRSAGARKAAAVILEVLAGSRTPTQAAEALSVTVAHYYKVESRALEGLVAACEPRPKSKGIGPEQEREQLKRQCTRLEQELVRWQALARASQKAVGLASVPAAPKVRGKRRRKPLVRALKAAEVVRPAEPVVEVDSQ